MVCFLVALTASQIQIHNGLKAGDQRLAEIFDSSHYLDSTRTVVQFIKSSCLDFTVPDPPMSLRATPSLKDVGNHLMLDGLSVPAIGALTVLSGELLTNKPDWQLLLLMESVLHGLCAAFVSLITLSVTGRITVSLVAGLVWAFYPAALAGSQRILTEILCALLLLAMVHISTKMAVSKKAAALAFFTGFLLEVLLLSKPVLAISAGLVIGLSFIIHSLRFGKRRALSFAATFVVGMAVLCIPWMALIKTSVKQWAFTPIRMPMYNIISGNNLALDGLATVPQGALAPDLLDKKTPASFMLAVYSGSPIESADLLVRKIGRLWEIPWNDFRRKVLGLGLPAQRLYHELIIVLGLFALPLMAARLKHALAKGKGDRRNAAMPDARAGTLVGAATAVVSNAFLQEPPLTSMASGAGTACGADPASPASLDRPGGAQAYDRPGGAQAYDRSLIVLFACILAIAGHLVYMFFEGVPRYGFTAVPFFIILGAWFLTQTTAVLKAREFLPLSLPWLMCVIVSFIPGVALLSALFDWPVVAALVWSLVWAVLISWTAYALISLLEKRGFARRNDTLVRASTSLLAGFVLTIVTLNIFHEEKRAEWSLKLKAGEKVEKSIYVPALFRGDRTWVMVLFDGDAALKNASVLVNGSAIDEKPTSIYQFYPKKYDIYAYLQMLSSLVRVSPDRARQWRALCVPAHLIKAGERNTITLMAPSGGLTIYGDYNRGSGAPLLPTYEFLSHSLIYCSNNSTEWRPYLKTKAPPTLSTSKRFQKDGSVNDDLSTLGGRQSGQFRILFVLGPGQASENKRQDVKAARLAVTAESFSPQLKSGKEGEIRCEYADRRRGHGIGRFDGLSAAEFTSSLSFPLKELRPGTTHLRVRFAAKAIPDDLSPPVVSITAHAPYLGDDEKTGGLAPVDPATGTANDGNQDVTCLGRAKPSSLILPSSVVELNGSGKWQTYLIDTQFPLSALRGGIASLSLDIFPIVKGRCAARLKDVSLEVKELRLPDLGEPGVTAL